VYCGKEPGTTEDHVFSRAFMGYQGPYGPKVPAGRKCQENFSVHEETLRNFLAVVSRPSGPRTEKAQAAAARSIRKFPGKFRKLNPKSVLAEFRVPRGIKLESQVCVNASEAIKAVTRKMVIGLIFARFGKIVHLETDIIVQFRRGEVVEWIWRQRYSKAPKSFENVGGVGVIAYRFVPVNSGIPYPKEWWFLLHGTLMIKAQISDYISEEGCPKLGK